jgi:hypothetical protein
MRPIFLLVVGVLCLGCVLGAGLITLDLVPRIFSQALAYGWGQAWPLFLVFVFPAILLMFALFLGGLWRDAASSN